MSSIKIFKDKRIWTSWDKKQEECNFFVVDVIETSIYCTDATA